MPSHRFYRQSRIFSSMGMPVMLGGRIELQQPVKAFKLTQGITITDNLYGVARNGVISIAFTAGATAGAEVVTVTGNAVSVQVESGVSTVTQVRTALMAAAAFTAIASATGTSSSTVAAATAVLTAGAVEMVKTCSISGVASALQDPSNAGTIIITLQDSFSSCIAAHMALEAATAVDLVPQLKSADVSSAKTIEVRLLAGSTATDPTAAAFIHMLAMLNNSALK